MARRYKTRQIRIDEDTYQRLRIVKLYTGQSVQKLLKEAIPDAKKLWGDIKL